MTDAQERPAPSSRVSDAERDTAAEVVRAATADGRLDLGELDERLNSAYRARTHAELAAVTADLPTATGSDPAPLHLRTSSGSLVKDGYWRVPGEITVECNSGATRVDFTRATCARREVALSVRLRSGSVHLVVPHGWQVEQDQTEIISGGVRNRLRTPHHPDAPVLWLQATVHSGALVIRHPRRGFWSWLLRRRS